MRERRPGVWEIRIADGVDARGRTRQRSTTVRGSRDDAESLRSQLAEAAAGGHRVPSVRTVGELLETWLEAEHPWRPSTWTGYRSNARHLRADPIAAVRPANLTPRLVRQAMARWQAAGATPSVLLGRFKALQAALGWAYDERLIDTHPLRGMRGPRRVEPRRPVADDDIAALLRTAEALLLEAVANDTGRRAAGISVLPNSWSTVTGKPLAPFVIGDRAGSASSVLSPHPAATSAPSATPPTMNSRRVASSTGRNRGARSRSVITEPSGGAELSCPPNISC